MITGCDSSGPAAEEAEVAPDETAEMIAVSLAEETGGTADDLASANFYAQDLSAAGDVADKLASVSFSRECRYADAEQVWTCDVSASRSNDRIDAAFSRTVNVQFFDADGQPRRSYRVDGQPPASLSYTILSGEGTFTSPRVSSEHTLPAAGESPTMWSVDGPGTGRLTINGAGSRTTDVTINGRRGVRSRSAAITTQASDIVLDRGEGIQSGTINGTYDADVLLTNDAGEEFSRTVSVEYEAVFTDGSVEISFTGGGDRFNGQTFTFSSLTGRPL
jgi:hypothetical protein